ncbi:response regulator transcription factor [Pedobacter steynii]|uniref:DNA-binding response regulator n=1 Tax=Pedobacter steynii TaxID=430522 RepID=A0A1D7QJM6_9SPHI|nr:response regulator transcription factor [Pedobacter steynii]AOM78875.1 DNA-binding response regulator [Pedobacter steynii]
MLKLILTEDHNVVRSGIKRLLEEDQTFTIVAEAINGAQALNHIKNSDSVDLVLTDINMPGMDGIELITEIKTSDPEIKVVVLSGHDDEKYVAQAFQAGASGYLLKNADAEELLFALKHISRGGSYLCTELSMLMLGKALKRINGSISVTETSLDFSSREMEVLELIAEGLTNQEMSDRLFISKRTVEGHRLSLTEKTGCRNTAALIRYAMMHDMLK